MGAPSGKNNAADGGSAGQARLACAHIHAVLELEETSHPIGIDVIRDRRSAECDGFPQDCLQSSAKPDEPLAGNTAGNARGTDPGLEKAFIGVDIAHAVEKRLVKQGCLNGELAVTEEGDKFLSGDGERFMAGPAEEFCLRRGLVESETAESAGVNEAQLAAGAERQDGVCMRRDRNCRGRDKKASSHAEMDDPLDTAGVVGGKIEDDVLADAVDALDAFASEDFGHLSRRGLEGLLITAEPYGLNALATDALIDAAGNGFNFGEFRHQAYFRREPGYSLGVV
jgi:hypothetical protein